MSSPNPPFTPTSSSTTSSEENTSFNRNSRTVPEAEKTKVLVFDGSKHGTDDKEVWVFDISKDGGRGRWVWGFDRRAGETGDGERSGEELEGGQVGERNGQAVNNGQAPIHGLPRSDAAIVGGLPGGGS